jgi:hypothetical protein
VAIDVPDWLQLTQLAAPGDLGAISIAPGSQTVSVNVNLSPYATGVIIVSYSAFALISWLVTGGVTGFPYITAFAVYNPSPPLIANVGGAIDNPLTIEALAASVNGTGVAQVVGHVYQLFGSGSQVVSNTPQQPLYVRDVPGLVPPGAVQLTTVLFSANLAPSGTSAIVTPVAGEQLIVYGYDISASMVVPVAGSYQATVQDTGPGVNICRCRISYATAVGMGIARQSLSIQQGLPLQQGAGIRVVAFANGANILVEGSIVYASLPYVL